MGMLETVVSEKLIPRAMVSLSSSGISGVVQVPSRSSTLSANQRLKGLLSRSSPRSPSSPPSSLPIVQHAFASGDDGQVALNEVSNRVLSASPPTDM